MSDRWRPTDAVLATDELVEGGRKWLETAGRRNPFPHVKHPVKRAKYIYPVHRPITYNEPDNIQSDVILSISSPSVEKDRRRRS